MPPAGTPGAGTYNLEDAETHIAILRGQADRLSEILAQNDITAGQVPNAPAASGYVQFSAAGQMEYLGFDGVSYDTGRLTLVVPSGASISINSAVTPVTIFTKPLGTGTYEIEAWLVTSNATAADAAGFAFAFSGTATGLVDFYSMTTGTAVTGYGASATPTQQFNGQGTGGNQRVHLNLTLFVTVAGTLKLTGIELVAGNAVTVFAGSRMRICPVVAT